MQAFSSWIEVGVERGQGGGSIEKVYGRLCIVTLFNKCRVHHEKSGLDEA